VEGCWKGEEVEVLFGRVKDNSREGAMVSPKKSLAPKVT
jgi:hypothetical protein